MKKYVYSLRKKPEHVRKQIFVALMVFSMTVVGSIWVYGLSYRFDEKVALQTEKDVQPLKLFGNMFKSTYQNISASVGSISEPETYTEDTENQIPLVVVEEQNQ